MIMHFPETWDSAAVHYTHASLQSCMDALCKRELTSRAASLRFNLHTVGVSCTRTSRYQHNGNQPVPEFCSYTHLWHCAS